MSSEDADPGVPGVLAHDFPALEVKPGEERNFICQSWTLHNEQPLYVNLVSMAGGPGWHHSNWLYAPEQDFEGPDGTWNCVDRGFELVEAGISGGLVYTQSPEVESEVQRFGPGVAVLIPAHSKIIAEVHLLNVSERAMTTHAHFELHTLAPEQAVTRLSPLALSYYPLALPAASRSEFTTDCDLATPNGAPLDFRVHYLAPHYHALGMGMSIESYDASGRSKMIYQTDRPIGETLGRSLEQPFDLTGAQGIRFSCRYQNHLPRTIGFGSGQADEMCVLFAFTDSPRRMIGGVLRGTENRPVEKADTTMPTFTSTCRVLALAN